MFVAVTWSRSLLCWVHLLLLLEWHHNGIAWVEQRCILTGDISESKFYCLWMDYYYNELWQYGEISYIYYLWARRDVNLSLSNATLTRMRVISMMYLLVGFYLIAQHGFLWPFLDWEGGANYCVSHVVPCNGNLSLIIWLYYISYWSTRRRGYQSPLSNATMISEVISML